MRVVVALEHRFYQSPDATVYPYSVCDYAFWSRYLDVFDEVIVFARISQVEKPPEQVARASGPSVRFLPVPDFLGPWQYISRRSSLVRLAAHALGPEDACILRLPGQMGTLLWHQAKRLGRPYGVEVVGDPWQSLAPGGVRGICRPITGLKARLELARQCRSACVASYVTEFTLQDRYPPGGWSTHYSSIELPDEAIIGEEELTAHLASIREAISEKRTLRICHMGTMSALYKGQDVLLEAVSLCRKRGRNVELTLLGEGRYYGYYVDKARRLGLMECVSFLGQLPPGRAVIEQLDAADLFVLPSFAEGLPRSLIEAMARGLPCLASKVGGIPELLAAEYLFPPKDPVALSNAIESLFLDRGKIETMARRNLETAKRYRSDELRRRRVEMYQKLKEETERWRSQRA